MLGVRRVIAFAALCGTVGFASADPSIDSGLDWLTVQVQADGRIAGPGDIATPLQATAEALRIFHELGLADHPVIPSARQFLLAVAFNNTETLARKIIDSRLGGTDLAGFIAELEGTADPAGGFGELGGFQPTALDTGYALEALALADRLQSPVAGPAVSRLLATQRADGSWADTDSASDAYVTALTLRALWHYRQIFNVAPALGAAREWLLSQRDASGLWPELYESAQALIAIIPTLSDNGQVQDSIDALRAAQAAGGSFKSDVFTTALALRALHLAAQPRPNPDVTIIRGRILDGDTALPLADVAIDLDGPTPASDITSGDGRFEFRNLDVGQYTLAINKNEYGPVSAKTTLAAGSLVEFGDIFLVKQTEGATTGIVRGLVTDAETGEPIANATVTADAQSAVTGADGSYQISDVPAGSIDLRASAGGYGTGGANANVPAGGITIFSPMLLPGEQPTDGSVLRGTVTTAQSATPLGGVTISVSGDNAATRITDGSGSYRIEDLQPGHITVSASLDGYDTVTASSHVSGNTTIEFSPALHPDSTSPADANTAAVSGIVVDSSTNAPLGGATVVAEWAEVGDNTATDEDGRFEITGIDAAEVGLAVELAGYQSTNVPIAVAPLETTDIGQIRLRREDVEELLPDWVVSLVESDTHVTVDPQTFKISGRLDIKLSNVGTAAAQQPVSLAVASGVEVNDNGSMTLDAVFGRRMFDPLPVNGHATGFIEVEGVAEFRDAPFIILADDQQSTVELDESNNLYSTATQCRAIPVPTDELAAKVKWHWRGSAEFPAFDNTFGPMVVAQVSDDNGDGLINESDVPDVIFSAYNSTSTTIPGMLTAVSGATGETLWQADTRVTRTGSAAAADLDGDGVVEIVIADHRRRNLLVFEHDGRLKWTAATGPLFDTTGARDGITIADLDGDGIPEILHGRHVFSADGSLLWEGAGDHGGQASYGILSIAVDLDLDGVQEVIAGRTAYRADGTILWHAASAVSSGFNAVGNFDDDEYPEIVLVASGRVYLLEHDGSTKWGPVSIPGGGIGGPPTVADVDGDGEPEIGVAGRSRYTVFETDGSIKWSRTVQDFTSNRTGSSVFDLNGDGRAEVLYADEKFFRIYDGPTGEVLIEIENESRTTLEYPVVADIDNDDHAEVLIGSQISATTRGVRALEGDPLEWMPTRSIWNQHAYNITNINDDGSVPPREAPSWLTHNTYRLNAFLDRDPLDRPDLTAGYIRILDNGTEQPLSIIARIGNAGLVETRPGVPVQFYEGDPASGGRLLGTIELDPLAPNHWRDIRLDGIIDLSGDADIFTIVDADGRVQECDETNNTHHIPFRTEAALGTIAVATDAPTYGPAADAELSAALSNTGSVANNYIAELRIEDADGALVTAFEPEPLGTLFAGAEVSLSRVWNTGSTHAGDYILRGLLYRDDGTLVDEATTAFAIVAGAPGEPLASLRTTTDKRVYHITDRVRIGNLVRNLTRNAAIEEARLRLDVRDPWGNIVSTSQMWLPQLAPGAVRELPIDHPLENAPEGGYRVTGRLLDPQDERLAQDSADFQVVDNPALALRGELKVALSVIEQGKTQTCSDTISNDGMRDFAALELRRQVARLDEEAVALWRTDFVALPAGGEQTLVRDFDTRALPVGDYACTLEARLDSDWQPLAHDVFRVKEPPIRVEAVLAAGGPGRVLILLDENTAPGQGHNDPHGTATAPDLAAQRAFLEALLTARGFSTTLVTSGEAFLAELRSGAYHLYGLFSEQAKLSEQGQKELREAVYRGEGLLVAGRHDQRHHRLDDPLGIDYLGKHPDAVGVGVDPAEWHPGSFADLAVRDKALRAALDGASEAGRFARDGSAKPGPDHAVTVNVYGEGTAVYVGYDLLAEATLSETQDSLHAELIAGALAHVQPAFTGPDAGRVLPLTLTLTNAGIALSGQVVAALPAGFELVDPTGAAADDTGRWLWPFDLGEQATETLSFWLRLPETAGLQSLETLVQVDLDGTLTDHTTARLDLQIQDAPGLDGALDHPSLNDKALKGARRHLERSRNWVDRNDIGKALFELTQAADALMAVEHPDAHVLRVIVGEALIDIGRRL